MREAFYEIVADGIGNEQEYDRDSAANSSTSWSLGLGTSMTPNGFRVRPRWSTELLRFPKFCGFIGDLQFGPLVFAPSTGSDLRSRGAVRDPFLAPISCKARGLIATVNLPERGVLQDKDAGSEAVRTHPRHD
jgi:hypothetical protein